MIQFIKNNPSESKKLVDKAYLSKTINGSLKVNKYSDEAIVFGVILALGASFAGFGWLGIGAYACFSIFLKVTESLFPDNKLAVGHDNLLRNVSNTLMFAVDATVRSAVSAASVVVAPVACVIAAVLETGKMAIYGKNISSYEYTEALGNYAFDSLDAALFVVPNALVITAQNVIGTALDVVKSAAGTVLDIALFVPRKILGNTESRDDVAIPGQFPGFEKLGPSSNGGFGFEIKNKNSNVDKLVDQIDGERSGFWINKVNHVSNNRNVWEIG